MGTIVFGSTGVAPKVISPTDPGAGCTAAANSAAVYAYSDNYLVDLKHAVIVDVEATTAIRQAEVGAERTMLDRTAEQFDVQPSRLVADASYGSAEMLGWLVDERGIEPHVKVFDKSERTDGTFSRGDFAYDAEADLYACPDGKELMTYRRAFATPRDGVMKDGTIHYRASKFDCEACALKPKCCAQTLSPARLLAQTTKPLATRPTPSPRRRPTRSHVVSGRRPLSHQPRIPLPIGVEQTCKMIVRVGAQSRIVHCIRHATADR